MDPPWSPHGPPVDPPWTPLELKILNYSKHPSDALQLVFTSKYVNKLYYADNIYLVIFSDVMVHAIIQF